MTRNYAKNWVSVQHTTTGRSPKTRRLLSKKTPTGQKRRASVARQLKDLRKAYPMMVKGAIKRARAGEVRTPLVTVNKGAAGIRQLRKK